MINTPTSVIDRINKMGEDEKQPDGIEFMSDGVLLFKDLYLNSDDNDDDSMASDDNFKPDKEYKEKFQEELKFRKEGLNSDDVQDDHFQDALQQHSNEDEQDDIPNANDYDTLPNLDIDDSSISTTNSGVGTIEASVSSDETLNSEVGTINEDEPKSQEWGRKKMNIQ